MLQLVIPPDNMFDVIKQEVKDVAAMIHQKENKGDFQGACSDLLEAIRKSDVRGKWQMFIDALKEVCVWLICEYMYSVPTC